MNEIDQSSAQSIYGYYNELYAKHDSARRAPLTDFETPGEPRMLDELTRIAGRTVDRSAEPVRDFLAITEHETDMYDHTDPGDVAATQEILNTSAQVQQKGIVEPLAALKEMRTVSTHIRLEKIGLRAAQLAFAKYGDVWQQQAYDEAAKLGIPIVR